MSNIYVLDRLINKPVRLTGKLPDHCTYGDKVVYTDHEGKSMVGIVL